MNNIKYEHTPRIQKSLITLTFVDGGPCFTRLTVSLIRKNENKKNGYERFIRCSCHFDHYFEEKKSPEVANVASMTVV